MKKINPLKLLVLGVGLFSASSAVASYTVVFDTDGLNAGRPDNSVFDVGGTVRLNSTFLGQLYVGVDAGSVVAVGDPLQFGFANGVPNAAFDGVITSGAVNGANGNAGDTAGYVLRAWNASAGASFETASTVPGAHVGSSPFTAFGGPLGGTPLGGGTPVTPPSANLHSSFTLSVVPAVIPEPSVLALGLLGGAVLMFRRRK